jgi:hypothetical protein
VLRDVTISNIVATNTSGVGCAIAGLPGHPIENLTLSNINIATRRPAEFVNYDNVPLGGTLADVEREIPENADAYPECVMFGKLPTYGLYIRHARGVRLDNIRLGWTTHDQRPAIYCDDVQDLTINGLTARSAADAAPVILLTDVRTALIRGCLATPETNTFLGVRGKAESISLIGNHLHHATDAAHLAPGVPNDAVFMTSNATAP